MQGYAADGRGYMLVLRRRQKSRHLRFSYACAGFDDAVEIGGHCGPAVTLFDELPGELDQPPLVSVNNDSAKTMYLKIGKEEHKFAPRSRKSLTVQTGKQRFRASSPGVLPAIGQNEFKRGYVYRWTFTIRKVSRPR